MGEKRKCSCGLPLELLMPGVAHCANRHLHIFAKDLCEAHGYPATEENIRMLTEVAHEMLDSRFPVTEED